MHENTYLTTETKKWQEFTSVHWEHTYMQVTMLAVVTILFKITILQDIVCESVLKTKLQNKTILKFG